MLLGLFELLIPLGPEWHVLYQKAVLFINERYQVIIGIFRTLPLQEIFPI